MEGSLLQIILSAVLSDSLESLPICLFGVPIDAGSQDALPISPPKGLGERATAQSCFPEQPDVQPLLGLFHCDTCVQGQAQVRCYMQAQQLVVVSPLYLSPS